ncbi:hypothetical protein CVT24_006445, partial [Panaeolus cyanescens]
MESDSSDDSLPERIPQASAGGAFRLCIPGGAGAHNAGHHSFGGKTIPLPPVDDEEDEEEGYRRAAKQPRAWYEEEEEEEEVVPKITYWIKIFSLEEQAKAVKHQDPKTHVLTLATNMAWDDAYSQLKIQAINALFPNEAFVPDTAFSIKYTVPCYVKLPLRLSTSDDYDYMVNATQKMKNREVQIIIKQLTGLDGVDADGDKENANPANVVPSAKDLLPGNQAKLENVAFLRSRWHCNRDGCGSTTCYIPPDGRHFPLGHDHIEKWAEAMLHDYQGEPSATLERPPNTTEFDPVSEHTIVTRSPILQARIKAMQKEKGIEAPAPPAPPAIPQPIINVVLPPNYGLPGPAAVYPPAALANGVMGQGPAVAIEPLIPPTLQPGFEMEMSTFTGAYKLLDGIVARLKEHCLTGTHAFAAMSVQDLSNMSFAFGKIIDLKR